MGKESDFQTLFSKYNSIKKIIGNFELKDTLGKSSLPYDCFEEQQIPSLLAAEVDGYRVKYSDADIRLKPFDYSCNPPIPGWIAIKFPKKFYIIPVKVFILSKETSNRKSITQRECENIAHYKVQC